MGGDVGRTTLHILHPESLGGTRIVPGVGLGAFAEAREAAKAGTIAPEDVKFFTRYAGWGPGQLEEEVSSGVWFLAACSASVILAPPPRQDGRGDLWAEVLRLMGGEYAAMAEASG